MLNSLTVKNIVLVQSLHLDLQSGLNVLSGETGAGKSILLDALGLAIGGRGDSTLVRNGTDKAIVTACFDVVQNHPIWEILKSIDVDSKFGEQIILNRSITKDGKSKASINGTPVPIKNLRLVGDSLVDVQGQFDQHGLLNPAQHMFILDNFARTTDMRKSLNNAHHVWQIALEAYNTALQEFKNAKDDAEYTSHCLQELEAISPKSGEEDSLLKAKAKLQNADKLLQAYQVSTNFIGGEDGADILIRKAERQLENIVGYGGKDIEKTISTLADISGKLTDVLAKIEQQAEEVQSGAGNLSDIDDRFFALKELARKHRCGIDDLENVMIDLQNKDKLINDSDDALSKLKFSENYAKSIYMSIARLLSEKRSIASVKLAQKVCSEIPSLGLQGAEFIVSMDNTTDSDASSDTDINIESVSKNGIDTIRFMAAMNAGAKQSPIHKSASGGELSRMLLGINVALAETNTATTLMFDEVDAGVGGKSASAIGARLQELSKTHQVFVITHSPQVAGCGDLHLQVSKSDNDGITTSTIKPLQTAGRINEIARMLSGANITDVAKENAKVLLGINDA